jgi:nucleoside-diphosphate-sugar epimerase
LKDSVLIFGGDGYIGWPLAIHLAWKGEREVVIVDNLVTRRLVESVGSDSLVPIGSPDSRVRAYERASGRRNLSFVRADARDPKEVDWVISKYQPTTVVHLAQQRSAPFSMIDQEHALYTELNNVATNLNIVFSMTRHVPGSHLLKMGCYDEQTEVLTRAGWKHFWELEYSDEVCSLDREKEEIVYFRPTNIVAYPYEGKMMRILTQNLDFLITPNHRVVYRYLGRQYGESKGPIHVDTSEAVFGKNFSVPKSGKWDAPDVESFELPSAEVRGAYGHRRAAQAQVFRMDRWLGFFGWYIAEGCIRRRGGEPTAVHLYQKEGSPKAAALEEGIRGLGLGFTVSRSRDKRRHSTMLNFEIANNHLANFLAKFGDSGTKFIPPELKNASRRQLKILFDALMLGDGHVWGKTGSMYYYSKSERLLSDVQEIAMKLGYGATICEHHRKGPSEYYLCISRHPNAMAKSLSQTWEPYDGLVYCCTVPTGIIMVRRNGKSAFSGNTMGEYGTPNVEITEGPVEIRRKGRKHKAMFPRAGQSWYHLSKVFDTFNVMLANKIHGLRATDVMQGVVYGSLTNEITDDSLATRFDLDSVWGTVINKYVAQAVVYNKLLIYGRGRQTRGYLSLYDSIKCLTLLLENPPANGEYRVVNQIDETFDTLHLARKVQMVAEEFGIHPAFEKVRNPRVESEGHFYKVEHKVLPSLGFRRTKEMDDVLREIFQVVLRHKPRAMKMSGLLAPSVSWGGRKNIASDAFMLPRDLTGWPSARELMELAEEEPPRALQ